MTELEAIEKRHSVRKYSDKNLSDDIIEKLNDKIAVCSEKRGLDISLVANNPGAFGGVTVHYGKFQNVGSFIVLAADRASDSDEAAGYYGEKLALFAQTLGLNTCWVVLTFSRRNVKKLCGLDGGKRLIAVITVGYGETQGTMHRLKKLESVCDIPHNAPEWFINGMKAVQLAPTAMNQQRYFFSLNNGKASAAALPGFCTKIDLGIAKYHFEVGAEKRGMFRI